MNLNQMNTINYNKNLIPLLKDTYQYKTRFIYILKEDDKPFYVGHSANLPRCYSEHFNLKVDSTKHRVLNIVESGLNFEMEIVDCFPDNKNIATYIESFWMSKYSDIISTVCRRKCDDYLDNPNLYPSMMGGCSIESFEKKTF